MPKRSPVEFGIVLLLNKCFLTGCKCNTQQPTRNTLDDADLKLNQGLEIFSQIFHHPLSQKRFNLISDQLLQRKSSGTSLSQLKPLGFGINHQDNQSRIANHVDDAARLLSKFQRSREA
jgi:hypothetical protein